MWMAYVGLSWVVVDKIHKDCQDSKPSKLS
jgi:hypothetical protein